jgi:hypothetical protein
VFHLESDYDYRNFNDNRAQVKEKTKYYKEKGEIKNDNNQIHERGTNSTRDALGEDRTEAEPHSY